MPGASGIVRFQLPRSLRQNPVKNIALLSCTVTSAAGMTQAAYIAQGGFNVLMGSQAIPSGCLFTHLNPAADDAALLSYVQTVGAAAGAVGFYWHVDTVQHYNEIPLNNSNSNGQDYSLGIFWHDTKNPVDLGTTGVIHFDLVVTAAPYSPSSNQIRP